MEATRQRGWWYPYIFVGCFVLVVAVNGLMAYFATSTFTGLETEGAYQKGLAYNQNLASARAQEAMGWTVETRARPAEGVTGAQVDVAVSYRDRDGKPVDGLTVTARMIRPTAKGHDHDVTLKPLGDGLYGGVFTMPLNGVWDMDILARGDGVSYEHAQRFVLK
jgi:Predicted integral membrane protein linked to a cation pump